MLTKLMMWLLRPAWVAFTLRDEPQIPPELGLRIRGGIVFALYKGYVYTPRNIITRAPGKREFGESLHPQEPRLL